MANPWFRFYNDAIDDEKLRLLAFEDRWHYAAILCCKNSGLLNDKTDLGKRKISVKMGLTVRELEEVSRRLAEVGLIDQQTMEPLGWDRRQFQSDCSTDRVKNWRKNNELHTRNVTETLQKRPSNAIRIQNTDTDTDTDKSSKTTRRGRFVPPTTEEVAAYCLERGNGINAEHFVDYNSARGWMVGKNKMVDWRAAVRTWERNKSATTGKATEKTWGHHPDGTYTSKPDPLEGYRESIWLEADTEKVNNGK